jgi:ligand-binding SRPBCC domain-containing protein
MIYRVQFEHWVPAPLEQVFRFFGDPNNLPRLMPAWMRVTLDYSHLVPPLSASTSSDATDHNAIAGAGSVIGASYRALPFLPLRIASKAQITGYEQNNYFEDIQSQGPFKSWHHRHEFASEVRDGMQGTKIVDGIEYDPGFGALGRLANHLFIEPQLRKTFEYRQQSLEELIRRGQLLSQ